mmetsp:Transcript_9628/g.24576  ORF Transcript_9628/g.24576 Transcript_9628/m.24576 type:complete len:205 (-) Transcript_9628:733-1347(-)
MALVLCCHEGCEPLCVFRAPISAARHQGVNQVEVSSHCGEVQGRLEVVFFLLLRDAVDVRPVGQQHGHKGGQVVQARVVKEAVAVAIGGVELILKVLVLSGQLDHRLHDSHKKIIQHLTQLTVVQLSQFGVTPHVQQRLHSVVVGAVDQTGASNGGCAGDNRLRVHVCWGGGGGACTAARRPIPLQVPCCVLCIRREGLGVLAA